MISRGIYLQERTMIYDKNNIFAKILRGEIPINRKIYENEHALSFHDLDPMALIHTIVIPKGEYTDIVDFKLRASWEEQTGFWDAIVATVDALGIRAGYRICFNVGLRGGQTIYHLHAHLMSDPRFAEGHL
jgi:diadenosine tetraphosphate (Ap4A) HIT family hydrolase